MYFWTYALPKTLLDKCLKSPVSEDHSSSNMANQPKHCENLSDSTFTIFIDPCESNSRLKSLSEWYSKSWDCLLTHWLPVTGILFLQVTIYSKIFRCNYLKNKEYFPLFFFFLHFVNLNSIFKIYRKKMTLVTIVFSSLRTAKKVIC